MNHKLEAMVAATAGIQRGLPRVETQQMDDNSKAATFIGWREGQRCTAHGDSRYPEVCKHGFVWSYGNHDIPAPDMTEPRNYMKALEGLRGSLIHDDEWLVDLDRLGKNSTRHSMQEYRARWRKTAGEAVVTALAALWDEEHADNARMKG